MTKEKLFSEISKTQSRPSFYECVEETLYSNELGFYISYGVRCLHEDGSALIVSDVSPERKVVDALVKRCNEEELECVHIYDVIEDFLAEMY